MATKTRRPLYLVTAKDLVIQLIEDISSCCFRRFILRLDIIKLKSEYENNLLHFFVICTTLVVATATLFFSYLPESNYV